MTTKNKLIILLAVALSTAFGVAIYAFTHQPPASSDVAQTTKSSYVSLGDSVAAGYGLFTDGKDTDCKQKTEAYPHLVAVSLSMELTQLACTGAEVANGVVAPQVLQSSKIVPPQLDALFDSKQTPKLITITAGANDMNWIPILQSCFTDNCASESNKAAIDANYSVFSNNVKKMIDLIQNRYKQDTPAIIVTGYYQIFPPAVVSGCQNMPNVTQSEIDWWHQVTSTFNDRLRQTVSGYESVTYVTPNFNGHELCTDASWVQGFQSSGPFHPTEQGQQSIADIVVAAYKN